MTALRLTDQRCAIIESKSMKERKENINIVTANIVSIGILAVSALVLYGIFFLIWDYQDWFNKEKLIEVMKMILSFFEPEIMCAMVCEVTNIQMRE